MPTQVVRLLIEQGKTRTFARALDWPGWCRAAKTEELAIDAMHDYRERYSIVVRTSGLKSPSSGFDVVERVPGDAGTEFGAPHAIGAADRVALDGADRAAWIALLGACWSTFDAVAAASDEELRKGARGGGRNRTKMVDHVFEAERAYAPKLGVRLAKATPGARASVAADRATLIARLNDPEEASQTLWPLRYWIHRAAWHVLDHAWEMQDKQITT